MGDAEIWRWIWVVVVAGFLVGEMLTPGTFFFLPFAAGAAGAAVAGFLGAPIGAQWGIFVGLAVITSVAFIPLRRRLDRIEPPAGVGAHRVLHQEGMVVADIGGGPAGVGSVRIAREQWRAESADHAAIAAGEPVRVVEVRGTSVIVERVAPAQDLTPSQGEHQ